MLLSLEEEILVDFVMVGLSLIATVGRRLGSQKARAFCVAWTERLVLERFFKW